MGITRTAAKTDYHIAQHRGQIDVKPRAMGGPFDKDGRGSTIAKSVNAETHQRRRENGRPQNDKLV